MCVRERERETERQTDRQTEFALYFANKGFLQNPACKMVSVLPGPPYNGRFWYISKNRQAHDISKNLQKNVHLLVCIRFCGGGGGSAFFKITRLTPYLFVFIVY